MHSPIELNCYNCSSLITLVVSDMSFYLTLFLKENFWQENFWRENFGGKTWLAKFWRENFGGKFWRKNFW